LPSVYSILAMMRSERPSLHMGSTSSIFPMALTPVAAGLTGHTDCYEAAK
jgi:hypothetical protein